MSDPLVLTLEMDSDSFSYFEELRRQHFPAPLNCVPAHISLFHRLPGEQSTTVSETVASVCASTPAFRIRVKGLRNMGLGVAFSMQSLELKELHAGLAQCFWNWLTPQDRQKFDPHLTVQNKVAPEAAKSLLGLLEADFRPFYITARGICLWRYLNGPWERVIGHPFGEREV